MIKVGAAIIREKDNILICQRGEGGLCSNLWEFPGGKQEPHETAEQCVIRECKEELGIEIEVKNILKKTTYNYPEKEIFFTFFNASIKSGEIRPKVHQDVRWVLHRELDKYEFCPADVEIVEQLLKDKP